MDQEYKPTLFDMQTQSHDLQIMKAMVPYLELNRQKMFAMMIKFMELQRTFRSFPGNSLSIQSLGQESGQERMMRMLSDISEQCNAQERENMDMLLNLIQIMSVSDIMSE